MFQYTVVGYSPFSVVSLMPVLRIRNRVICLTRIESLLHSLSSMMPLFFVPRPLLFIPSSNLPSFLNSPSFDLILHPLFLIPSSNLPSLLNSPSFDIILHPLFFNPSSNLPSLLNSPSFDLILHPLFFILSSNLPSLLNSPSFDLLLHPLFLISSSNLPSLLNSPSYDLLLHPLFFIPSSNLPYSILPPSISSFILYPLSSIQSYTVDMRPLVSWPMRRVYANYLAQGSVKGSSGWAPSYGGEGFYFGLHHITVGHTT